MAHVVCEVVNKPLDLRGPLFAVGERLTLDPDIPLHRAVLEHEGDDENAWVRRMALPASQPAEHKAAQQPEADRMVTPEARQPQKAGTPRGMPGKTVTK